MNPQTTLLIDQYLLGELSEADRLAFEIRLKTDNLLQQELELQQNILEAAKRAAIRMQVQTAAKNYHFNRNSFLGGIALLIVAAGLSAFFIVKQARSKHVKQQSELTNENIPAELKELVAKIENQEGIENLKSQYFQWSGNDSVFLSKHGVLLSIPKNAFLLNGKPYNKPTVIQWQEALDPATIVKSGLSTVSGDRLLETQGMFGVVAYTPDGQKLSVNPNVGLYVQVPVAENKQGMMLFEGKKDQNGIIDWQNPKALKKIPVPVDMAMLDFYPPHYEDSLNAQKLRTDKKYRDSLYLSLEIKEQLKIENKNVNLPMSIMVESSDTIRNLKTSGPLIVNITQTDQTDWQSKIEWSFSIEQKDEAHGTIVAKARLKKGWHIFSVDHDPKKADLTGFPTKFSFAPSKNYKLLGKLQDANKPIVHQDKLGTSLYFENQAEFRQDIEILSDLEFDLKFTYEFQICDVNGCIFPPRIDGSVKVSGFKPNRNIIRPSKVMAFWKPEFNNTILATREFENRMKTIHSTCNPKVLELYTSNLSAPLSEVDALVVKMGYPEFQRFVDEQVGALDLDNKHLENLRNFYAKSSRALRTEILAIQKKRLAQEDAWDQSVAQERNKAGKRYADRQSKNFQEEFDLNLNEAYRQLGKKTNFNSASKSNGFHKFPYVHQSRKTVAFTITSNVQIYNIDRFVANVTTTRKTATFTDPKTGKKATITYNDFAFEVENAAVYTQLYAYLFPNKLNSYQRILGSNGKFSYPLNNGIIYDLVIVGISEKGYCYAQKKTIKQGNFGKIQLNEITESKLNASIEQVNAGRISKPMLISDELAWLFKEQQNYVVQKNRQEMQAFRKRLSRIVFPCEILSEEYLPESEDELINIDIN